MLSGGLISTINLSEAHAKLLMRGSPPRFAWNRLRSYGFEICPFSEEQARITAELVAVTKRYGLSLGDRACLALAMERKTAVYTTDRAWKELEVGIRVEVIR